MFLGFLKKQVQRISLPAFSSLGLVKYGPTTNGSHYEIELLVLYLNSDQLNSAINSSSSEFSL